MEWIAKYSDIFATAAYWLYTIAACIALLMVPLVLSENEALFWVVYLPLWLFALPMAGGVAIALTVIRQVAGPEWKLLALLVSTTAYLVLFVLEATDLMETDDFTVTVSFGAVSVLFCGWHFLSDRTEKSQESTGRGLSSGGS